ncbi:hypothetical protein [Thalassobacillus sp. CUG 92003]|uniref:hypothetical protein n=1 Tax=Thalassobacillus sp. CUG 92003 TaxID=2736641 RepID=UPI0015E76607|nr:hypothetical protein [Thalassobacillus sp. CUG 92003]
MTLIYSQPFTTTSRVIQNNVQHYTEIEKYLNLYEDKITAPYNQFHLQDVFDVSYRPLSASYGFLYLHTNQGVFSYTVKTSPESFINEYKRLK